MILFLVSFSAMLFLLLIIKFSLIGAFLRDEEFPEHSPKVSVIVAAWNEERVISDCVESILDQKYKNDFELIVVGGGTDKTSEILRKFSKNKNFKFTEEKEARGKWFSLNTAISQAKYDSIALLDADTIPSKNWLSTIAKPLFKYDLVEGPYVNYNITNSISRVYYIFASMFFNVENFLTKYLKSFHMNGANMAFKKSVWKKGKFENYLLEDLAFYIDARSNGFKRTFSMNALVKGQGPTNYQSFSAQNGRFFRGLIELILKKGDITMKLAYFTYLLFFLTVPISVLSLPYLYLTNFTQFALVAIAIASTYIYVIISFIITSKNKSLAAKMPFDLIVLIGLTIILVFEQIYLILTGNFKQWTRMERA